MATLTSDRQAGEDARGGPSGFRFNVSECDYLIIFENDIGRNVTVDNATEYAIAHDFILPLLEFIRAHSLHLFWDAECRGPLTPG